MDSRDCSRELAASRLLPPIKSRSEIRILELAPEDYDDGIHCELLTKDLASKPKYKAISYTWADENGDSTKCRTIFVSGEPFSVTRNCERVLKRMRRRTTRRALWIDAVCIDQDNVDERGHQVRLMTQIYSLATNVIIYIGEADENTDTVFDHLNRKSASDPSVFKTTPIGSVLTRRYFTRLWTIQEVTLATTAVLVCGRKRLPWTKFTAVVDLLFPRSTWTDRNTYLVGPIPPAVRLKRPMYASPDGLLGILDTARHCQVSDPRDKVFGLLGLVPDAMRDGLVADYNLSVEQLYVKLAVDLAAKHGYLPVLTRAGINARSLAALPSWVPDWSHSRRPSRDLRDVRAMFEHAHTVSEVMTYHELDNTLSFHAITMGDFPFGLILVFEESLPDGKSLGNFCFPIPTGELFQRRYRKCKRNTIVVMKPRPTCTYNKTEIYEAPSPILAFLSIRNSERNSTGTSIWNSVWNSSTSGSSASTSHFPAQCLSNLSSVDVFLSPEEFARNFTMRSYEIPHYTNWMELGNLPWAAVGDYLTYGMGDGPAVVQVALDSVEPAVNELETLWLDRYAERDVELLKVGDAKSGLLTALNDVLWRLTVRRFRLRDRVTVTIG
ncbi:heterokaryon incompatibility protein-domain-containing protein [Xylariaceae sp. FL1272]|nr:heterokaryon incompatibility protein-domain-containing protein [Xylariaceae sp. FL1272]